VRAGNLLVLWVVTLGVAALSGIADLVVNWHHNNHWLLWLGLVNGWLDELDQIWCSRCLDTDNWIDWLLIVNDLSVVGIGDLNLLLVVLEAGTLL
jgi:hypothetical protein